MPADPKAPLQLRSHFYRGNEQAPDWLHSTLVEHKIYILSMFYQILQILPLIGLSMSLVVIPQGVRRILQGVRIPPRLHSTTWFFEGAN